VPDVRNTTIYEGTPEIMEMTIARDRWQQNLKSSGHYYPQIAAGLHARNPDVGAGAAALACQPPGGALETCRAGRRTRNQHVLLRLGELVAHAECAGRTARRQPSTGPSRQGRPAVRSGGPCRDEPGVRLRASLIAAPTKERSS
jgi:hypothetical protein